MSSGEIFRQGLIKRRSLEDWLEEQADEDPDLHAEVMAALADRSVTATSLADALAGVGLHISASTIYRWRRDRP